MDSGYLTVTPGNVVDYDYILNDLITMSQGVRLFSVAYDSWNATQFTINAQDRGLPMNEFSQVLGNFNRPTKEFERLILSGQVDIDNNEITRFCFKNVVLAMDRNGNAYLPIKKLTSRFLLKYESWLRSDRVATIKGKSRKLSPLLNIIIIMFNRGRWISISKKIERD